MDGRRWTGLGLIWAVGAVGLVLSGCGADPAPAALPHEPEVAELPPQADRTVSGTASPTERTDRRPASAVAATDARTTPRQARGDLDQPAIWPAADVVFDTPEEAAADFVSAVLISEGDPLLGEFQQGDARSGEIPVLFAGETGDLDPPQQKGLLLLRRIGPTDGWYVIAAVSDGAVIDRPSASEAVPAGTVTVSGEGRGFEGTLAVSAFPPGDVDASFDSGIGAGGAFDALQPYRVDLDLSGASPGDVAVILVRGDTGLGNDPSTFAAIPIVITSGSSPTIPASR